MKITIMAASMRIIYCLFIIQLILLSLYWFITQHHNYHKLQVKHIGDNENKIQHIQQSRSLVSNAIQNRYKNMLVQGNLTSHSHNHTIVLWTGLEYFFAPLTLPDYLTKLKCKFTNCQFTCDRFYVNKASALLFHARNLNNTDELPIIRNTEQYYIWYHLDRPVVIRPNLSEFQNVFNLTMTYRLDSDAPIAYGKTVSQTVEGLKQLKHRQSKLPFLKKDNRLPVAWMVSHCKTDSRREEYVHELQKYIQVDIYGECGNLSCPKSEYWECKRMIESKYKFYLSFENTFCKDYVTEKTFEIMNHYIVPIVMGSANYTAILPPHSFIDVNDFDSPRALATYLKDLERHPDKYLSYFEWKEKYIVKNTWQSVPDGFCTLCEILNTHRIQHKVYSDIAGWHFGYCYDGIMDSLLRNVK